LNVWVIREMMCFLNKINQINQINLPVSPAASAIRKVDQDNKKNNAVSNKGKSDILVNFVVCTAKLRKSNCINIEMEETDWKTH